MSRGDGYLYSGNWLEDLPHGQGIAIQAPAATVTTCIWSNRDYSNNDAVHMQVCMQTDRFFIVY